MMTTSNFSMGESSQKFQAPSSKLQRSSKFQTPIADARIWNLLLDVWFFIGAWMLEFGALEVDWQLLGVLDALLHRDQKRHRFLSIYRPVIVAEREIHHRANHDLVFDRHRAFLDRVHPENPALGRIQDRGAEQRAVNSAIRNRERAALQILDLHFPFARFRGVIRDVALEFREALLVGIAHHRNNEAALRPNRDADVVELVLNKILAFDPAVDRRKGFQCYDRRLYEERHEPELKPILFRERILRFRPELLHRRHVALVESGEDGRGMLSHHQLRRDLAP